jgi:alkanesulfonate monooxygenase SsuD/methylene tetrahydromethanopterin reductase-like flavin-dependent oxidoreductase (luciferase family)
VAVAAEDRGFAHVWVGDHVVWNVGMLASLCVLSYAAAATERIGLGTGVYLLPLRHPTVVAKDVETLNVRSRSRANFGVGIGGENPLEYAAMGVEMRQRGARLEEAVQQLQALLRGDGQALDGTFHQTGSWSRCLRRAMRPSGTPCCRSIHPCVTRPSTPSRMSSAMTRSPTA